MIILIPVVLTFLLVGFWLWMIVDLTNHPYLTKEEKNNWFVRFLLLNVVGAYWYYLVEYKNRNV